MTEQAFERNDALEALLDEVMNEGKALVFLSFSDAFTLFRLAEENGRVCILRHCFLTDDGPTSDILASDAKVIKRSSGKIPHNARPRKPSRMPRRVVFEECILPPLDLSCRTLDTLSIRDCLFLPPENKHLDAEKPSTMAAIIDLTDTVVTGQIMLSGIGIVGSFPARDCPNILLNRARAANLELNFRPAAPSDTYEKNATLDPALNVEAQWIEIDNTVTLVPGIRAATLCFDDALVGQSIRIDLTQEERDQQKTREQAIAEKQPETFGDRFATYWARIKLSLPRSGAPALQKKEQHTRSSLSFRRAQVEKAFYWYGASKADVDLGGMNLGGGKTGLLVVGRELGIPSELDAPPPCRILTGTLYDSVYPEKPMETSREARCFWVTFLGCFRKRWCRIAMRRARKIKPGHLADASGPVLQLARALDRTGERSVADDLRRYAFEAASTRPHGLKQGPIRSALRFFPLSATWLVRWVHSKFLGASFDLKRPFISIFVLYALLFGMIWCAVESDYIAPTHPTLVVMSDLGHLGATRRPVPQACRSVWTKTNVDWFDDVTIDNLPVQNICARLLPDEYPGFRPVLYAFDVLIPLIDLRQQESWSIRLADPGRDYDESVNGTGQCEGTVGNAAIVNTQVRDRNVCCAKTDTEIRCYPPRVPRMWDNRMWGPWLLFHLEALFTFFGWITALVVVGQVSGIARRD